MITHDVEGEEDDETPGLRMAAAAPPAPPAPPVPPPPVPSIDGPWSNAPSIVSRADDAALLGELASGAEPAHAPRGVALRERPPSRPTSQSAVASAQQVQLERQRLHMQQRRQQQSRISTDGPRPTRRMSTLLGEHVDLRPRADQLSIVYEIPSKLLVAPTTTGALPGAKVGSYVFASDARHLLTKKWEHFSRTAENPASHLAVMPPANPRHGSAALDRMKASHAKQMQQAPQRPITAAARNAPSAQKAAAAAAAAAARPTSAQPTPPANAEASTATSTSGRPMSPRRAQGMASCQTSAVPVSCTSSDTWHANY